MKSLLILVAILMVCSLAYAGVQTSEQVIDNTTNDYQITGISTTTIVPGRNDIVGWEVLPLAGQTVSGVLMDSNTEGMVGLYDETVTTVNPPLKDEDETPSNSQSCRTWYTYPMKLETGLVVYQGPKTRVIIHYVK